MEIGQTIKIGYFGQEVDIEPELRVIDYVKEAAEFVRTADGLVSASAMLERFLFPPEQQYSPVGKLSGGEKRRLYLLRVLMSATECTDNLTSRPMTWMSRHWLF